MEIRDTVPSSIDRAIEDALQRTTAQFKMQIDPKQLQDLKPQLMEVFKSWPGEAHPRFVSLFVELWAIAQFSRLANEEPLLTDRQIRTFLGHSMEFLNCFFHR